MTENNTCDKWVITVFVSILIVFLLFVFFNVGYNSGQIDALTGHQTIKMVTNNVSTVTWEKIK